MMVTLDDIFLLQHSWSFKSHWNKDKAASNMENYTITAVHYNSLPGNITPEIDLSFIVSMETTIETETETDMDQLIRKLFDYFIVLLSLEYIFGTIMNAIILVSILKTPKLLSTPFYVIIAGLCMSECLGGLGTPLRLITNFAKDIPFKIFCIIYEAIFMMIVFLNNYNLLIISCERICSVRFPVFYKNQVTVRKVVFFMAASWVFFIIVITVSMTLGN